MNSQFPATIFLIILILFCAVVAIISFFIRRAKKHRRRARVAPFFELTRESCNPLFSPQDHYDWENEATFNPAAIVDDDGIIHLFYRAIGSNGISQIGHSSSLDGNTFGSRSPYPVYQATIGEISVDPSHRYDQIRYTSGGGWAGCEDPKTVVINKRMYMTYVAFEGWHSIRIGLTSIALSDLKQNRWNWSPQLLISPKGEPHKNWTLFPEKIHGKFAILHCISPQLLIEYVDDLQKLPLSPIKSRPPHDGSRRYFGRETHWDSWVRGAGAPPLKTTKGWLLLYHAMDRHDPDKYKLGAMLLDLNDPTIIRYRSPHPILSPSEHYENDSKPGVIYASGAVIRGEDLLVYYGGGDKYVCTARTRLADLLDWLVTYGEVSKQ
ncbi:MAG TPA: hypothetical protein VG621_02470 [Candidatus Paceibacterota bacterium]|nr:hypothetical protein [Candidatus Paceibacterota bacterium]